MGVFARDLLSGLHDCEARPGLYDSIWPMVIFMLPAANTPDN